MKQISKMITFDNILADDQARRVSASVESLDSLKNSINSLGLLDPLIVEGLAGDKYKLRAGRNRFTAIKELRSEGKTQFDEVPCTVLDFDEHELLDDNYKNYKISQVIFDSNDKRSQLTKFEQARHYAAQKDQFPHLFRDDAELAKFNNKPVNEVVEALRLLSIDPDVIARVEELNLQAEGTIPFMCLEEIAEAASLPKRPLPADGQMRVIDLLIGTELPDKRALVARDKMRNLVNTIRREYAPDPRGRKPKIDDKAQEQDGKTAEATNNGLFDTPDSNQENAVMTASDTEASLTPRNGYSSHGSTPSTESGDKPATTTDGGSVPITPGTQDTSTTVAGSTSGAQSAVSTPTLSIVKISINNAINALRSSSAKMTASEHQTLTERLAELRQLIDSAVLQTA